MSRRNGFGVGALEVVLLAAGGVMAGDLTPPGPPGATMRTLQEIYDKIEAIGGHVGYEGGDALASEILSGKKAWVGGAEVTGTMPNVGQQNITPGTAAQTIPQGYHDGTGEVAGDADLLAGNIRSGVSIFGVSGKPGVVDTSSGDAVSGDLVVGKTAWAGGTEILGIRSPAPIPKTGQTTSYRAGDDGALQKGVALPNSRFTDNGDETVTDNMTGLIWVKAPHDLDGNSGTMTWDNAIDFCNGLTFAGHSDWRLPNIREMHSLIDYGRSDHALPSGHPFTVVSGRCWSSSTVENYTDSAWQVDLTYGFIYSDTKKYPYCVWPVRAGQ